MILIQRDLEQVRRVIAEWLGATLPGADKVSVGVPTFFDHGFSAELLQISAEWTQHGGIRQDDFVVRVEPSSAYQLFLDTNFYEQFRALEALDRHTDTLVPNMVGFESDESVFGSRFYIMRKMPGRTGLVTDPWMVELGPEGREVTWWNGLAAMASLHRANWESLDLDLLQNTSRGKNPLDQQLAYYGEYYDWVREGKRYPVIEAAAEWLQANRPDGLPTSICWGDARRGNQLFAEDLSCTAILDFEQVCLGTPECDLGWWLMGEARAARQAGVEMPDRDETVARYGQLIGRPIRDIGYFEVFAAYRIAVLIIKLTRLCEDIPGVTAPPSGEPDLKEMLRTHTDLGLVP